MSDLDIIDKEKIIPKLIIRLDRPEGRVLELERKNIFLKKENEGLYKQCFCHYITNGIVEPDGTWNYS